MAGHLNPECVCACSISILRFTHNSVHQEVGVTRNIAPANLPQCDLHAPTHYAVEKHSQIAQCGASAGMGGAQAMQFAAAARVALGTTPPRPLSLVEGGVVAPLFLSGMAPHLDLSARDSKLPAIIILLRAQHVQRSTLEQDPLEITLRMPRPCPTRAETPSS